MFDHSHCQNIIPKVKIAVFRILFSAKNMCNKVPECAQQGGWGGWGVLIKPHFSPSLLYSMHFLTTLCRFCRYLKKIGDFGGLGQAKYDLEAFVKYDIQRSDKYSRKRHARWWPGPSLRTAAVQGSRGWEEANCNAVQEKYDFHKIGKYGMC